MKVCAGVKARVLVISGGLWNFRGQTGGIHDFELLCLGNKLKPYALARLFVTFIFEAVKPSASKELCS